MLQAQSPVALNVDSALTRVILRGEMEAYACVPVLFSQAGALPEAALEDLIRQVRALDMEKVRAEIAAQEQAKPA